MYRSLRRGLLLLSLLLAPMGAGAQEVVSDTTLAAPDSIGTASTPRPGDAAGVGPLRTDPFPASRSPDLLVARGIRSPAVQESVPLRVTAGAFRSIALPGTVFLAAGLYTMGSLGDNPELTDLGLDTGYALIAAGVATLGVKLLTGRGRPHLSPEDPHDFRLGRGLAGDRYQSFPSAHTAAAFAAASVLAAHSGGADAVAPRWLGPVAYSGAGIAGLSRLYHEEHWLTDVLAGAILGTVAGIVIVH